MGRRSNASKRKRTDSSAIASTDTIDSTTMPTEMSAVENDANTSNQDTPQPEVANATITGIPLVARKKQKREEYRAKNQADEENGLAELPRKKFYRQRAHANPFSDHTLDYPISPSQMDWSSLFPEYVTNSGDNPGRLIKNIDVADVGCGFGGLLFALAPKMPDSLILGLEIRVSVTEFVTNKIRALRHQAANPATTPSTVPSPIPAPIIPSGTTYQNIATHRTNTMKFLPNFLPPASLSALFLCFPDPHFKARKHKARIVSATLCAEYFWVIRPGGRVYTITDVEDLAAWMAGRFDAHPGFRRVWEAEWRGTGGKIEAGRGVDDDGVGGEEDGKVEQISDGEWGDSHDWKARLMLDETEEGKKVTRNGGKKFVGIWERLETPAWPGEEAV